MTLEAGTPIGKYVVKSKLAEGGMAEIYLANGLQPGFIPHAEYVGFIEKFGKETEAFYKQAGVIE